MKIPAVSLKLAAKPSTSDFSGTIRGRVVEATGSPVPDAIIHSIGLIIGEGSTYGTSDYYLQRLHERYIGGRGNVIKLIVVGTTLTRYDLKARQAQRPTRRMPRETQACSQVREFRSCSHS